jgi:flagellar biogenesis protein FliO
MVRGPPHRRMDFFQQIAAVLIVLAALAAVVLIGKQRGSLAWWPMTVRAGIRTKRMQVLERLPLTPHHSLHLVNVDGRTVLVSVSPGGCQLLDNDAAKGQL